MNSIDLTLCSSGTVRRARVHVLAAALGVAAAIAPAYGAVDPKGSSSAQAEARPRVESQRKQEQEKAQANLDREAVAAIGETEAALAAIVKKDKKEALDAIARATGKLDILLARNQRTALIPVKFEVEVADNAPVDPKAIENMGDLTRAAVKERRFGTARALLDALRSEIRVRTYNLPLATYPAALATAARLIDEGKNTDASRALMTALNTLVIVDKPTSIPLLEVEASLKLADEAAQKTDEAQRREAFLHLAAATIALKRAEALGHVEDQSAKDLQKQLDEVEHKLKGHEATGSTFTKLRDGLSSIFKKQAQTENRGSTPKS